MIARPSVPQSATAFAPACVGNVAVGFDLLGHALTGSGDRVTARRREQPGVTIEAVTGVARDLPLAISENTAGKAAAALLAEHAPGLGVGLHLEKGIAVGAGLGGSAASAVAAVVAVNALLPELLTVEALYPFALAGESVASGAECGDNVAPQLLGGLVLAAGGNLIRIPVPEGLTALVVQPDLVTQTRATRAALEAPFALADITAQQANLARVLAGCYSHDFALIRAGLADALIEPRRAATVPGLAALKRAARDHGALGASISGAGPSVFAWFESAAGAGRAAPDLVEAFAAADVQATTRVSPVAAPGALLE